MRAVVANCATVNLDEWALWMVFLSLPLPRGPARIRASEYKTAASSDTFGGEFFAKVTCNQANYV